MKICGYCKKEKPLDEFAESHLTADGVQFNCERCRELRKAAKRNRTVEHEDKADPKPGGKVCCCGCYRKLDEHFHREPRETGKNGKIQIWHWHSECWQWELETRLAIKKYPKSLQRIASIEGTYRGEDYVIGGGYTKST